jgi:uncharacterized protein DUF6152
MRRRTHFVCAVGICLAAVGVMSSVLPGSVAHAHHSIASLYDEDHQVMLEGVVTRFTYVNPHPILMLTVTDTSGRAQVWRLEMDNRVSLSEVGFRADTLKAGDTLVVTGSPARNIPHSLYLRKLERPSDGFVYEHPPF